MRITILADNYVDKACLVAEHGFSCLIETGAKKILFDTGQGALLNNMQVLGITEKIDMIILSHGHYDHTGGLASYLKELSGYSHNIYASRYIFDNHLKKHNDNYSYIGIDSDKAELEQKFNLILNDAFTEIDNNIFLSGSVKRYEDFDADKLLYAEINGKKERDLFRDEQYLAVKEGDNLHIITGCTHCGASNLIKDVNEKFPDLSFLSLSGGLHMFRSDPEQISDVVKVMELANIEKILTGHCTGLDASMALKQLTGRKG